MTHALRQVPRNPFPDGFRVVAFASWADHDPTSVEYLPTEPGARIRAALRPEPLVDVVREADGVVIACRRVLRHPEHRGPFARRDDFETASPECWRSECPSGAPEYPHPLTAACEP